MVDTASHQLTPFFFLGACGGLVLARRCTLTGLPVLLGVILIGWVSFAAVAYWSGHLADVFGGLGHLGANVSTSVTGRLAGSTSVHVLVLYMRTGLAAAVMILAALGFLRRRHRAVDDRVALVLLCVPFLAFGLQNYGGEIALRIYLFALPAASVLLACLLFPSDPGRRPPGDALPGAASAGAARCPGIKRQGRSGWRPAPPLAGPGPPWRRGVCALAMPAASSSRATAMRRTSRFRPVS